MKKFLVFSLMLGVMAFVVPSVEAKSSTATVTADPQINVQIGPRRNNRYNRRTRTVTRTRITWIGRSRYRETYRITYFANGRTRTQVISRVRIGGRGIRY